MHYDASLSLLKGLGLGRKSHFEEVVGVEFDSILEPGDLRSRFSPGYADEHNLAAQCVLEFVV